MLLILGLLMFVLWLVDNAAQHPATSVIHFCSSMACLAFVAEFLRTRVTAFQQSHAQRQSELPRTAKKAPSSLASKPTPIQQV
jgi:hypothetical protein